jgi:hypothetical protein
MRPRVPVLILAAGVLAAVFGAEAPSTQSRVQVPASVEARTAAGESVRVIVGVDARFVPEGQLEGAFAVSSQRAALRAVVTTVAARAAAAGVRPEPAFDGIPFFPATVTRESLARLRALPGVTSIEAVQLAERQTYQSVPLTNTPAAVAAGFNGSGWSVAVLDSGSDYTHSMLAGSLRSEACYSSGGVSLCPGGAIESLAAGSGMNCDWFTDGCDHGTHVASIAVGSAGTSFGPGMAPGAWLIPMQVFHYNQQAGGLRTNSVDYIKALARVLALAGPNNVNRIAAVNMSLGGGQFAAHCDGESAAVKAAIDNLRSIGIATVVASGNNGYTGAISSPACISTAVSVGATSKVTPITVGGFSNEAPFLSLLAPGVQIDAASSFGLYDVKDGTSMAAPHVAGAWAILKQAVPSASVTSVLAALRGTGTLVTDHRTGRVHPFINVNAARLALQSGAYSTPGAPTNVSGSASGNTLSLSWAPPAPGGGAVAGYTVHVRATPGGPIVQQVPVGAITAIAAPVPNGVYVLSVSAANSIGAGPESAAVTVAVPAAVAPPAAPTNLTASVTGTAVTFAWSPSAGGGAVTGYTLLAGVTPGFAAPIATVPLASGSTSFAVGGVPPGTYYARIVAQGPGGASPASNEVVLTVAGATPPGVPTLHAPSVSAGVVTLSWSPGPGAAPTSYVLTAAVTPSGAPIATVPLTGSSVSFGGVPRGTYYLRLTAVNAAGAGAPSSLVTLVVP